jgi:hypothetical protein
MALELISKAKDEEFHEGDSFTHLQKALLIGKLCLPISTTLYTSAKQNYIQMKV